MKISAVYFWALSALILCLAVQPLKAQDDMAPVPYSSGPTSHANQPSAQSSRRGNILSAGFSRIENSLMKGYEKLAEWAADKVQDEYTQGINRLNWTILTGQNYSDLPAEVKFDNDALQALIPFNSDPARDDLVETMDDFVAPTDDAVTEDVSDSD